jgi:polyphenol oxidase
VADTALAAALAAARIDWIVPDWPAPANVHAVSTTRRGSEGRPINFARQGAEIARHRATLEAFLPAPPLWLAQQHGIVIVNADIAYGDPPRADGAIARNENVVCAVLSADCMPALFTDRSGGVVAAAHAGWRGMSAGVLDAAIEALGVQPSDVIAWLGPAIGPSAFEVGDDVLAAFCDDDPGAVDAFVANRPGKWHADLYSLARRRLARLGVTAIYGGDRCTFTERDQFYSYRRGGGDGEGRMATAIWRTAEPA